MSILKGISLIHTSSAYRLEESSRAIARALERLSTGSSMSSPAQDPARFASTVTLTSKIRGLRQAIRNINESHGMLAQTDGVLETQTQILQRMREIALQASNGLLSSQDRRNLETEFQTLIQEVDRLASSTDIFGRKLLDGQNPPIEMQIGTNYGESILLEFGSTRIKDLFPGNTITSSETEPIGTFSEALSGFTAPGSNSRMEFGDFDGDGDNDMLINRNNVAVVALNDGEGNFSFGSTVSMNSGTAHFTLGDLNGDGHLDMLASGGSNAITIRLGDGTGSFGSVQTINTGYSGGRIRVGDIDGDGDNDIVSLGASLDYGTIYINDGSGSFSFSQTLSNLSTSNVDDLRIGDITGDGINDIVILENQVLHTFISQGDGTANFASTQSAQNWEFIQLHDLNGDGLLDVMAGGRSGGFATLETRFANGTGGWSNVNRFFTDSGTLSRDVQLAGDFNGDGFIDAALSDPSDGTLYILLNDGTGSFTVEKHSGLLGANGQIHVVDLNGDSYADIFRWAINSSGTTSFIQDTNTTITATHIPVDLSIQSQELAQDSLTLIDSAMATVLGLRSSLGAQRNRLEIIRNLQTSAVENLETAKSARSDTDYATEVAELLRSQFSLQAQLAVRAQASVSLQLVLSLLQNR